MALLVESVLPAPNSAGHPLEQNIQVTFDQEVNQSTVDAGSFVVSQRTLVGVDEILVHDTVTASTAVDGAFSFQVADGKTTVTFNPTKPLEPNAEYTVILGTDILALDGSALASIYKWKFTTGSGAVVEPPAEASDVAEQPYRSTPVTPLTGGLDPYLTLVSAVPALRASNLPLTTAAITLTFSKDLAVDGEGLPVLGDYALVAEPVDGNPATPAAGALTHTVTLPAANQLSFTLDLVTTPLLQNNIIVLTFQSLAAADGSPLAEPLVYYFTTAYNPLYSSVRLVRSKVGSYIANIPDDTINLAIYAASRDADWLTPDPTGVTQAFLDHLVYVKARYALVTACLTVLLNSDNFGFRKKSKMIGDLEVSWEQSKILEKLYDDLRKEQEELEEELETLGQGVLTPQMTVKGALDWDRPLVGRDFVGDPYLPPAANCEVVPLFSRRKLKTYAAWPLRPRRII